MGDFMNTIDLNNIIHDSLNDSSSNIINGQKIGEKIMLIKYYDNSFLLNCFNEVKTSEGKINEELKCAKRIEKEYSWINTVAQFLEHFILTKNIYITNVIKKDTIITIELEKESINDLLITIEIHDNDINQLNELNEFIAFICAMNKSKKNVSVILHQMSKEDIIRILAECDKDTLIKMLLEKYNSKTLNNKIDTIKNKQRIK